MSVPRTKPWEVASGTSSATASGGEAIGQNSGGSGSMGVAGSSGATGSTTAGGSDAMMGAAVPERPSFMNNDMSSISNSTPYGGSTGYGNSYGSGGGYGSRYGGYGSSMYGGGGLGSSMYGGGLGSSMYGGGYGSSMYGMGGYGSGMYGMGGYGSGMYGQQGGMAGGLAEGTQATFQLIESIIGAVGGFSQMLEATYMATHSSFFTMVSLAEQFGNLKNALGSLLGIFALIKFVKKIFYKLTGQVYNNGINLKEFSKFEQKQKKIEEGIKKQQNGKKRISFKPLLLFLAASIGFPYLLSKAIQKLNEQNRRNQLMGGHSGSPSQIDPSNIQFAKVMYDFNPENPNIELELKNGDLVAILTKNDPMGNQSKWWKVRSRSGKVGYVPSNFLAIIERKSQVKAGQMGPKSLSETELESHTQPEEPLKNSITVEQFNKFQV